MGFEAVYTSNELKPPARIYLRSSSKTLPRATHPIDVAETILKAEKDNFEGCAYLLSMLWAQDRKPMMDIFGVRPDKYWPGNPTYDSWVYRDDKLLVSKEDTCRDGIIMLGKEERFRRTCLGGLEEYLHGDIEALWNEILRATG